MMQEQHNLIPGYDYSQLAAMDTRAEMARTLNASQMQAQQQTQFMLMQQTMQQQQPWMGMGIQPSPYAMPIQQSVPEAIRPYLAEPSFNDRYLGGGRYEMERSTWRDIMHSNGWGGLANTSIGRTLHIGGRRPEYLSAAEHAYQIRRSQEMRWGKGAGDYGEWGDAAAEMGMLALNFIPWVGPAASIAADVAFGRGIDERRRARKLADFSVSTRSNLGTGQRYVDDETSRRLSAMFEEHDHPAWSRLWFIGDRLKPDTSYEDVYKWENASGGLKNIDPQDHRKIYRHVKETTKLLEDYAGVLNATKEAVHDVLKKLTQFNITKTGEREAALNQIGQFRMVMGTSAEEASNAYVQFRGRAMQAGVSHTNAASALMEQASYFDTMIQHQRAFGDPMQLAANLQNTAIGWQQSPLGMYASAGGSMEGLMSQMREFGGGKAIDGLLMLKMGIVSFGSDATEALIGWLKDVYAKHGSTYLYAMMDRLGLDPATAKSIYEQVVLKKDIKYEYEHKTRAEFEKMAGKQNYEGFLGTKMMRDMARDMGLNKQNESMETIRAIVETGKEWGIGRGNFVSGGAEPYLNTKYEEKDVTLNRYVKDRLLHGTYYKDDYTHGDREFLTYINKSKATLDGQTVVMAERFLKRLYGKDGGLQKEDISFLSEMDELVKNEKGRHRFLKEDFRTRTREALNGHDREEINKIIKEINERREIFGTFAANVIEASDPNYKKFGDGTFSAQKVKSLTEKIVWNIQEDLKKAQESDDEKYKKEGEKKWLNITDQYRKVTGDQDFSENKISGAVEDMVKVFSLLDKSGGKAVDVNKIKDMSIGANSFNILKSLGALYLEGNKDFTLNSLEDLTNSDTASKMMDILGHGIGGTRMEDLKRDLTTDPGTHAANQIGHALWSIAERMGGNRTKMHDYEPPPPTQAASGGGSEASGKQSSSPTTAFAKPTKTE